MLVVKCAKRPEILDRTIEAVLDTYDQQVGEAEKHFLNIARVNRDDPAVEATWIDAIGAIGEMWTTAAMACFQVGQLYAEAGGIMPVESAQAVLAKAITA